MANITIKKSDKIAELETTIHTNGRDGAEATLKLSHEYLEFIADLLNPRYNGVRLTDMTAPAYYAAIRVACNSICDGIEQSVEPSDLFKIVAKGIETVLTKSILTLSMRVPEVGDND